jgi:mycothiol synthase
LKLEIRKFQDDDLLSLLELMNSFEREPLSLEDYLSYHNTTANGPEAYSTVLVATVNGLVVGFSKLVDLRPFESDFEAQVGVILEARGRGIGTKLLEGVLESARLQNATRLKCEVMNLDAHDEKFLDKNGIKIRSKTVVSKLEMADFDPVKYQNLETKLIEEGYCFKHLADFSDTPETRENLYQLVRQSTEDDSGFAGEFETLEKFNSKIWNIYWQSRDLWCLALYDSTFVALAGVAYEEKKTKWNTNLTGVARTHRKRGLAQIVKANSIIAARQYGAQIIITGNNVGNHAMISINRKMEFQYVCDSYWLELLL